MADAAALSIAPNPERALGESTQPLRPQRVTPRPRHITSRPQGGGAFAVGWKLNAVSYANGGVPGDVKFRGTLSQERQTKRGGYS
jgi:hypothetical protein